MHQHPSLGAASSSCSASTNDRSKVQQALIRLRRARRVRRRRQLTHPQHWRRRFGQPVIQCGGRLRTRHQNRQSGMAPKMVRVKKLYIRKGRCPVGVNTQANVWGFLSRCNYLPVAWRNFSPDCHGAQTGCGCCRPTASSNQRRHNNTSMHSFAHFVSRRWTLRSNRRIQQRSL